MPEDRRIVLQPIGSARDEDKERVVSKYIQPHIGCSCCNLPEIAIQINRSYLSGRTYKHIIEDFADKVEEATGKKLELADVSEHFSKHFDFTGAAIAEFNRKSGMSHLPVSEQKEMKDIFSILTQNRVNDLELLEFSMKEQVKRLQELEEIKKTRIEEGRTFNLENLIMKQEVIMNNLQMNVISKLKMWSKAMLQSKQAEYLEKQLQFLDPKTADFLGLRIDSISPAIFKEAEQLYLKTVIECTIKRIKISVESALKIDTHMKTQFYREFQKQLVGIENEIDSIYQTRVKELKEVRAKE